jgi:hypothetical protein
MCSVMETPLLNVAYCLLLLEGYLSKYAGYFRLYEVKVINRIVHICWLSGSVCKRDWYIRACVNVCVCVCVCVCVWVGGCVMLHIAN